jgi:hypothetical protein
MCYQRCNSKYNNTLHNDSRYRSQKWGVLKKLDSYNINPIKKLLLGVLFASTEVEYMKNKIESGKKK